MATNKKKCVNRNNVDEWKDDTRKSVELYNRWFLDFAPATYIRERTHATERVDRAFLQTDSFKLTLEHLTAHPELIAILRIATTPPLARDHLIGLSGVSQSFVRSIEEGRFPKNMTDAEIAHGLEKILHVVKSLLDRELLSWTKDNGDPDAGEKKMLYVLLPTGCAVCGLTL